MAEPVFLFRGDDPRMTRARQAATESFRFFWRELSWERRRIVPGLDYAMVKLPFTDGPRSDGNPEYEHMWVNEVGFDGTLLSGRLINDPNWLTSVANGDPVEVPLADLSDWLIAADGVAYGGFAVHAIRAQMNPRERREHDKAWGLEFGDPSSIRVEVSAQRQPKPGILASLFGKKADEPPVGVPTEFRDHPMCTNMLPKVEDQLRGDPSLATSPDENGWTLLHHDALAGNLGIVELLLKYGAEPETKTPKGKTAATLARDIGWYEIAALLESHVGSQGRGAQLA